MFTLTTVLYNLHQQDRDRGKHWFSQAIWLKSYCAFTILYVFLLFVVVLEAMGISCLVQSSIINCVIDYYQSINMWEPMQGTSVVQVFSQKVNSVTCLSRAECFLSFENTEKIITPCNCMLEDSKCLFVQATGTISPPIFKYTMHFSCNIMWCVGVNNCCLESYFTSCVLVAFIGCFHCLLR